MARKTDVSFTLRRKAVLSYYVASSKDGIVFGVRDKRLGDVHLTLFYKEGKLRSHITDTRKVEKSEMHPWGTQFHPKMIVGKVQRIVGRWTKPIPYYPMQKAWIMPKQIRRKSLELGSMAKTRISFPLETHLSHSDTRKWKRVRVRDAVGFQQICITDIPKWSMVFPLDEKRMIAIPIRSAIMLQQYIAGAYGFTTYFEYVSNELRHSKDSQLG